MNFSHDIVVGLLKILAGLLIVFLLFKLIWEIYRRLKGKELEAYDEDSEIPYGVSGRFFASAFFAKFLYQMISVKVWGLIAGTIVSTWLATKNFPRTIMIEGVIQNVNDPIISGVQWTTFNTTIWALIFGMKEVFKVAEQHSKRENKTVKELQTEKTQTELEMTKIKANQELEIEKTKAEAERILLGQIKTQTRSTMDSEGHEIVNDDPDK